MHRLTARIEGIGLFGVGLSDWQTSQAVLTGRAEYRPVAGVLHAPAALPPAERRRASKLVKLALSIGEEAVAAAGLDPSQLPTVFSSSGGDGYNCHAICEALASGDRQISPIRFHNSVNNAAAGYWSIATGSRAPSSVLCGFDASFSVGLLEAVTQVVVEGTRCLLVAYDGEYPEPLRSVRPIPEAFGLALVLAPERGERTLSSIHLTLATGVPDRLADPSLEALRQAIPAARSLPLLAAIARGEGKRVMLEYLDDLCLAVTVEPCS